MQANNLMDLLNNLAPMPGMVPMHIPPVPGHVYPVYEDLDVHLDLNEDPDLTQEDPELDSEESSIHDPYPTEEMDYDDPENFDQI